MLLLLLPGFPGLDDPYWKNIRKLMQYQNREYYALHRSFCVPPRTSWCYSLLFYTIYFYGDMDVAVIIPSEILGINGMNLVRISSRFSDLSEQSSHIHPSGRTSSI